MKWKQYQQGMYEYYKTHTDSPLSEKDFLEEVKNYKDKVDKYVVYYGYSRNDKERRKVVYVGTTIQHPMSRWYYHSIHGKNLDFVVAFRFDNEKDMLQKEYEEIVRLKPSKNKIKNRPQNFNVELTKDILESRKGNPLWCQCCLRRHVTMGYKFCYFCEHLK